MIQNVHQLMHVVYPGSEMLFCHDEPWKHYPKIKEGSHKLLGIVNFHFHEIFRIERSIEIENRLGAGFREQWGDESAPK